MLRVLPGKNWFLSIGIFCRSNSHCKSKWLWFWEKEYFNPKSI